MAGELIIFPVRLGVRVSRFAVRAGFRVTGQAVALATGVVKSVSGNRAQEREWPAPPRPPAPSPPVLDVEPVVSDAEPTEIEAEPTEIDFEPTEAEPVHVSEEPELVEEYAEPGAEDGAGAEVTIAEPWDGYRHMKANDVIERIRAASPAELAAVQLYENAHRHRETVLSAVRRELRAKSGSRAPASNQVRKEPADG